MEFPEPLCGLIRGFDWNQYLVERPEVNHGNTGDLIQLIYLRQRTGIFRRNTNPDPRIIIGTPVQSNYDTGILNGRNSGVTNNVRWKFCIIYNTDTHEIIINPETTPDVTGRIMYKVPEPVRTEVALANCHSCEQIPSGGIRLGSMIEALFANVQWLIQNQRLDYLAFNNLSNGSTRLIIACKYGAVLVVNIILPHYNLQQIEYRNRRGQTALSILDSQEFIVSENTRIPREAIRDSIRILINRRIAELRGTTAQTAQAIPIGAANPNIHTAMAMAIPTATARPDAIETTAQVVRRVRPAEIYSHLETERCLICSDPLDNVEGPGPNPGICNENCNDVIEVCPVKKHKFHRGCILRHCLPDQININVSGISEYDTMRDIVKVCPYPGCGAKLSCDEYANKARVEIDSNDEIDENTIEAIVEGGRKRSNKKRSNKKRSNRKHNSRKKSKNKTRSRK